MRKNELMGGLVAVAIAALVALAVWLTPGPATPPGKAINPIAAQAMSQFVRMASMITETAIDKGHLIEAIDGLGEEPSDQQAKKAVNVNK